MTVRTVRRTLAAALLILIAIHWTKAQSKAADTALGIETVDFCDLMRHPDHYDGKTVKVTATYADGLETAIFFDDACKESEAEPYVIAAATFPEKNSGSSQAFKKLTKFLHKYKVAEARMTIIAAFTDEYSPKQELARLSGPRYTLEVKQCLTVRTVTSR
jgi:hypothetical protein